MTDKERALAVYQQFKDHLDKKDFNYESSDDDMVIKMTVHGQDLPQPTIIHVFDDRQVVQIVSPIPIIVPEDKRVDMAIAVSVANYGMINGCFDLDMSDGTMHFRIAHCFDNSDFSAEQLEYLIKLAFLVTDKYNDRFFMLCKGMISIEDFMAKE